MLDEIGRGKLLFSLPHNPSYPPPDSPTHYNTKYPFQEKAMM